MYFVGTQLLRTSANECFYYRPLMAKLRYQRAEVEVYQGRIRLVPRV